MPGGGQGEHHPEVQSLKANTPGGGRATVPSIPRARCTNESLQNSGGPLFPRESEDYGALGQEANGSKCLQAPLLFSPGRQVSTGYDEEGLLPSLNRG